MANKMERFTNHARRILSLSQEAAEKMGHFWIEPEHILIAMSSANDTSAYLVLSDVDIIAEKLLPYLRNRIPQSKQVPEIGKIGLSDATIAMLDLSVENADKRELLYIDPSVLLLSLMEIRHTGIEAALGHFGHDSEMIIEMTKLHLAEDELVVQDKPSLVNNFMQTFQEFFRKKKNDE